MFAFPPSDDFDHRLIEALDHPARVRLLELLAEHGSLTAGEALPLLRNPAVMLSHLTYHLRVLHQFRLIGPTGKRAPGGGVSYRTTPRGETALAMLGVAPSEEERS
jgi:DNA-binding transcriptional ArsR family regulator